VPGSHVFCCVLLQRLDLSTSIKNPRRDFSNGFLAAEMMGRFYVSSSHRDAYQGTTDVPHRPLQTESAGNSPLFSAAVHTIEQIGLMQTIPPNVCTSRAFGTYSTTTSDLYLAACAARGRPDAQLPKRDLGTSQEGQLGASVQVSLPYLCIKGSDCLYAVDKCLQASEASTGHASQSTRG
jgi:hypothetical protein